ncbi:MAG: D-alanyl-D-alanine carboxypeptidase family protein [Caulobacteraceae bacterium]|nr:D-alanyl-D-alanine carboxypeptidase family protein [Caulobacteraceae bacterium]
MAHSWSSSGRLAHDLSIGGAVRRGPWAQVLLACLGIAACSAPQPHRNASFVFHAGCDGPEAFDAAAEANAASLDNLAIAPFGRTEQGWAVYAPRLQRDIGARCPPDSPGFAARLARWQGAHGLKADGVVDAEDLLAAKNDWQNARPFYGLRMRGFCPDPPREALAALPPDETVDGESLVMRRSAAEALHRLLRAAWREAPETARGPNRLAAFSGYRSPTYDAARCARDGDCNGLGRAACSPHRTGLAVDLVLGSAPGYAIDSSADANRLYQTRTAAYRWLLDNAGRFGFVNYAFEPWHWEWTGEAP